MIERKFNSMPEEDKLVEVLSRDNNGPVGEAAETERLLPGAAYRAIFDALPGQYLVLKPDAPHFTVMAVSDAYTRARQARPDAITGQPLWEVLPAGEVENLTVSLTTVLKTRKPHTITACQKYHNSLLPDGTREERYFSLVSTPVLDERHNISYIILAVTDITETIKLAEREQQARQEIEAQRQHYYDLFMHAPAFIAVISGPELVFEIANPLYHQLVGNDRSLEGRPLLEVIPDIDPNLLEIVKNVAFNGERFVANELPIMLDWNSKGEPYTKYVNLIYEPLLDGNNIPNGLFCFGYDVTRQVATRQEIEVLARQVEYQAKSFDTVLTSVKDFIYTFDTAGRFTYSNRPLLDLLGITLEQITGKNFFELPYPAELAATLQAQIASVVATGKPIVAETAYTNPAGNQGYYEYIFVPITGQDGQIEAVAGSTRDITDRKQVEAALQTSQVQFKALTEANIVGVMHCDLTGTIFEVNEVFLGMLGYTRTDLAAGKLRWDALTPLQHKASDEKAIQELLATGRATPWEKEFIKKDGNLVPVILGVALVNKATGECVSVVLDITERKRLEERKDEFISIASHELKTPLSSIKGYSQLLGRLLQQTGYEKANRHLAKIRTNIDRLENLINDLLDVSKIQAGKIEYNITEFDFDELVKDGVESVESIAGNHLIEIEGTANTAITADRNRLEQVFTNLLTNAIKYSPQSDRIVLSVRKNHRQVEVAVQDFGIGIPAETRSKIFERYYRVETSAKSFSGLGIGLYISNEIIERHGGTLKVESQEGQGSTFTFTIPLTPRASFAGYLTHPSSDE